MSYLNKNIQNRRRIQKNIYGELDLDIVGTQGPPGPQGPIGPQGPPGTGTITTLETIGTVSESLLVASPDTGPVVELKGLKGSNLNTDVSIITSNNNLLFDVSQMQPIKAGVIHGRNDISSATSLTPKMSVGYNTNPNYIGSDVLYVGDQNSLNTVNTKNKVISIGHYNTSLNLGNENDSILLGNHIKQIGGVNNDIYIGNDILKNNDKISGNDTDNVIISNSGLLHNNGIVRNNCIIGDKLFVTINGQTANIIDNIIIGSECELLDNSDFINNLFIGNKINCRTNNSIIIHQPQSNISFSSNHDNMFYIGDSSNQPTSTNNFVISSGYNKYQIYGIPAPVGSPVGTDYILHYDEDTGEITKKVPDNVGSGARVFRGDPSGLKLRTFTGTNGILVSQLTDEVDIAFDNGLLPIDMEPTVSGLAYGKQDQGILFTGLGRELVPKDRSISIFNQTGSGDIQNYNGTDNILINNYDNQNSNTNALMSNIITNNCVTKDCNFDHSTVLASELDMGGISAESCTLIGNFKGQVIGNCREAMYITNNAGAGNLQLNGRQSLYLGNATYPETVNDREAYISGYDRFFLRTPQNASNIYQLYYDPSTSEVTWADVPPAYILPDKQPTTSGASFGLNFASSGSEMTGRNSFNNYTSGTNINAVTSVGNNHFTLNTSATFSNSMLFGSTIRFNSLLNMSNSLIASNIINNTGVTSIQNNAIIMPKTSSLTVAPGITSLTGTCFLTSSDISLTNVDPNYSVVVGSGSTVNPGANNMVIISGGSNSIITMQGLGNILFQASGSSTNYTSANFSNGVIFNSGSTTVAATANSQFNACHSTLRMPNLLQIGTNVNSNNVFLLGWNSSTGLISPYLTNTFSRVYRQQANTNAAGVVVFNTGTVVANAAGTTYHAQVINASTTNAYICQTGAITANTVTIQVFVTQTIILGGQPVTTAPINTVVSFSMNY